MTDRLHVLAVVGNDIVNDARVRKAAAAAARAGFRSTILCYTSGSSKLHEHFDGVDVIKIPVPFTAHIKNGRTPSLLRPFNAPELAERHKGPRVYQQMKKRRIDALFADPDTHPNAFDRLRRFWIRVSMLVRHDGFRARRKVHSSFDKLKAQSLRTRKRLGLKMTLPFRDGVPNIADYEVTFGPIIEDLKPDLIHAHDYHMIGLAVTAARNLRSTGTPTKVLYDAHELIQGLSYPRRVIKGWLKLEEAFIHYVDAVTGVSHEQVERIRERYDLGQTPSVVMNAPMAVERSPGSRTVKDDTGVDGRILVYHGNVTTERGVDTLVEALPLLANDVHVALVAPDRSPAAEAAADLAAELGVDERFHRLPYVPGDRLLNYLGTADLAVIPYLRTENNDIALPNKLFESLQAGLPVLVSDMTSMERLVGDLGVGEVFTSGSADHLAEKAKLMLDNLDHYRRQITQEVKELASWDSQAVTLVGVYSELFDLDPPTELQVTSGEIETATDRGEAGPTQAKLAIGPRNMAGQAYAIAAAVQRHLDIPAVSYSIQDDGFGFSAHHDVSIEDWRDPAWQRLQRRTLRQGFTHVIAESGTGMLGALNGGFIDEQAAYLEEDGLNIGILLHGSDIRDPRRHRQLPYSPYRSDDDLIEALDKATHRLRNHLERIDAPVFVTTPDLLEDIDATWLPVVVDDSRWSELRLPFQNPVPVVLHMPTNGLMKGSQYVDPVLKDLHSQGKIRYLRPGSGVSSRDVADLVEAADIVVDQLVIGAYGLMSCQAMMAGRISIANIRDIGSIRPECPVVHADPDTFEATMTTLLDASDDWPSLGDQGRAFVARYHDGTFTAQTLQPFLKQ